MSGWQLTLTKESKGKILGVWRAKTHHLHFPARYNSAFLWDLPLVLSHKHQLVRNHLLGCINYLSVAGDRTPQQSLCFTGDAVPNDRGNMVARVWGWSCRQGLSHLTFTQEAQAERTRVGIGYQSMPGSTMSFSSKASPLFFNSLTNGKHVFTVYNPTGAFLIWFTASHSSQPRRHSNYHRFALWWNSHCLALQTLSCKAL